MTDTLLTRDITIRGETTPGSREFTGIAVPWDTEARVFDWDHGLYTEVIARGAVQDSDNAMIFWRHAEPIGKITANRDADDGWEITAKISETERGNEVYTLLRDGVIDKLSIGFEPIEHTETAPAQRGDLATITRTKIKVREISLVPFPAYETANVNQVRSAQIATLEVKEPTVDKEAFEALTAELRQSQEDHQRAVGLMLADRGGEPAPASKFRSAGEALQALYREDADAIEEYGRLAHRAYTGGTSADAIQLNTWVGDLTRLVEGTNPLAGLFSTGLLPKTGNTLEYGQLKSNTTKVGKQATEGADLVKGKIVLETKSAPVETFGGWTELTRQQIERSSVPFLDQALRAMAIEAGKYRVTSLRAALAAARAAQVTAGNEVTIATADTYAAWFGGIVDATGIYQDLGLAPSELTLVTDATIFKVLGALTDTAGRPLFNVTGTGVNAIGTISPTVQDGNLAGLRLRLDAKQTAPGATFTHPLAIRTYDSPTVTLQDSNIVNLSEQASVYAYGAMATEMPGAIAPVKIGTGA